MNVWLLVAAINGATIALEGDDRLMGLLADLAEAIGGFPVRLPKGSKAAYHAAAVLASGGLVALLDAISTLGAAAGRTDVLAVVSRTLRPDLTHAILAKVTPATLLIVGVVVPAVNHPL